MGGLELTKEGFGLVVFWREVLELLLKFGIVKFDLL